MLGPFAFYEKSQVVPVADAIREEYLDLVTTDEKFQSYMSCGTDTALKMKYRAEVWCRRLEAIIGEREPRCFSRSVREGLYGADPSCSVLRATDSVRGRRRGRPRRALLRLVHRYCNRARGARD